jgi:hypothetical protein
MLIDISVTVEEFVAEAESDDTMADCAKAVIAMLTKFYITPKGRRLDHGGSLVPPKDPATLGEILLGAKGRADGSVEDALGIDADDAKAILAHLLREE